MEIQSQTNLSIVNLSRPIQYLSDQNIITRELPFAESSRTTKKTLFSIKEPVFRFWYSIFSPHRTRWKSYTKNKKLTLLNLHASTVFEDYIR